MADIDPALGQKILDVAERQRVSHVHRHDQTDHFWRAVEISERIAHGPKLPRQGTAPEIGLTPPIPAKEPSRGFLGDQHIGRGKSAFVFPGGRPRRPLSLMAMSMLLRRLGVEATVHGFRSAARSWMADNGVEFELAEAALAHVVGNSVVQAYQRSSMLERRRPLMESWGRYVTGSENNVVAIKRRVRSPLRA
jgi:integrase